MSIKTKETAGSAIPAVCVFIRFVNFWFYVVMCVLNDSFLFFFCFPFESFAGRCDKVYPACDLFTPAFVLRVIGDLVSTLFEDLREEHLSVYLICHFDHIACVTDQSHTAEDVVEEEVLLESLSNWITEFYCSERFRT